MGAIPEESLAQTADSGETGPQDRPADEQARRVCFPENSIHHGDNLPFMAGLPDGCFDLIYIDPPFCSGRRRTAEQRGAFPATLSELDDSQPSDVERERMSSFSDVWTGGLKGYLAFLHPRLEQCRRVLAEHGTMYVHLDWRTVHYVKIQLDTLFGYDNFLNEIVWHYRTGGVASAWFGRKHDTILAYAKILGKHNFKVQREGEFRTDGLKVDESGRPYKTTRKGRLYFNPEGPAMTDVWDIPFLSTVSKERAGWPTQKPLALLDRIMEASSRPGDVVADFFCGSGTTLVAAKRMGRRWVGCDVSPEAVAIARRRLDDVMLASLPFRD